MPDLLPIIEQGGMAGLHVVLVVAVYVMWKRQEKLERLLMECLQSGGEVDPAEDLTA